MQTILDNSQSPYAQLLASSSLLKVITDHTLRYNIHSCTQSDKFIFPLELLLESIDWCFDPLHGALHCSLPIKLDMRNYFMAYLDRYVSSPSPHRLLPSTTA